MAPIPDKNDKPKKRSKPKEESRSGSSRTTLPFLDNIEKFGDDLYEYAGLRLNPWPLFILGVTLLFIAFLFMPSAVSFALSLALFLAPVWLPFLLVGGALALGHILKQSEFLAAQKYVLLEIKLPRNLVKTPLAMEAFLSTLHLSGGESNWYLRNIKGSTRPFWSLEMASFEGQVHFFIWGREVFRRLIETQLYSQYPGVQLVEAVDYTRTISGRPEDWDGIWGCDFKQTAKDSDPLPIKTYIEYGLDKVQKEPEQVDPFANLVEFMGSVGKGEYLWLQFVIRFHNGEKYHKIKKDGKPYTWRDKATELVDEIRKKTRDPYVDPVTGEERPGFPNPTKGQSEKIAAIERNVSKLAFDVGIRSIYFVKGKFSVATVLQMIALFKPFNTEGWNGINSASVWMKSFNDYPWEIGINKLKDKYRRKMVEAYRRRQFFYEPFSFGLPKDDIMVMSTEELATLYHIPSSAVAAPGLGRIQSATGEAPVDLPV
ncbi:MAG: phage holin family protein [Candidatus Kaiserbacteria bacterium]|nr:phage holin family protein [Candidatus Kaiserbacteria bacterium]